MRVPEHCARAALLRSRRVSLRTHGFNARRRCFSTPGYFVHLLGTYAFLRLKLLVPVQRACCQGGVRLRGGLRTLGRLHSRLRLLQLRAQGRIVQNYQSLSSAHGISLMHHHLLDAAHDLSRHHSCFSRMNRARGSQTHGNQLLLAFDNLRMNGLCVPLGCGGFTALATGYHRRGNGKQTCQNDILHCRSSAASGVRVPIAYKSSL